MSVLLRVRLVMIVQKNCLPIKPLKEVETKKIAFQEFDADENECRSRRQLIKILFNIFNIIN